MKDTTHTRFDRLSWVIAFGALAGAVAGLLVGLVFTSWWVMMLDQGSTKEALSQRDMNEAIQELVKDEAATIEIVNRVSPAVVSVTVRKSIEGNVTSNRTREDGLVDVGSGTAFFVDTEGLLLTNRHVVEDEDARYFITMQDGDEREVDVVARDTLYDVAVLRVQEGDLPEEGFPTVVLAGDEPLQIGQTVIAVGNALGEFNNTVTKGIISGINRDLVAGGGGRSEHLEEVIQTDAAINPGNSGGPLVNLQGEVIGINTAVSNRGSGLGFAIPISVGRKVTDDVRLFGRIVRPWLGVRYVMLSSANTEDFGLPKLQRGAYILSEDKTKVGGVVKDSPADVAGLQEKDVIVNVNDRLLTEEDNLATILNTFKPGDTIELLVLREGDMIDTVTVTLGEFDASVLE